MSGFVTSRLDDIAARLRAAPAVGDAGGVLRMLAADPLVSWYAIPPFEFAEMITAALASGEGSHETRQLAHGFLQLLRGEETSLDLPARMQAIPLAMRGLQERLRGAPSAALKLQLSARRHASRSTSALFDTTEGLAAFESMQLGITRMLVGDFTGALVDFAAVGWNPSAALPLLTRDAEVKSAVVHALYGSPAYARRHIVAARALPPSGSWAEAGIDAHLELAEAVLDEDAASAIARLEAIPLSTLGEMWPFHIEAVYRAHARAGRGEAVSIRLQRLQGVAPPAAPGDGLPGNIFAAVLAFDAFIRGDAATARRLHATMPSTFFRGVMMEAMLDIGAGRPDDAIRTLSEVRVMSEGLDQLEGQRLALLAQALFARGDRADALTLLAKLRDLPDGAGTLGSRLLTKAQHEAALADLPGWDHLPPTTIWPSETIALTERERELLAALHAGLSRAEIAEQLFVSINTVKTHQRSLFRKLGVTTRAEAAAVAERRGLL